MAPRDNNHGYAHYLTFSIYHHKRLFANPVFPPLFLQHLDASRSRLQFHLWAYVVMPDHVHLLLHPVEGVSISSILQSIKLPFSKAAIQLLRERHPASLEHYQVGTEQKKSYRIWQRGGGYDRNLYSPDALRRSVTYIHNNPVVKSICDVPEEYPWSSAGFWLLDQPGQIEVDVPEWW